MSGTVRAVLISLWVLAVGLLAVVLEVDHVRCGVQIRSLLRDRDERLEKIRRMEMRYNKLVSPDVLEDKLPQTFRPVVMENPTSKVRQP